MSNKETIKHFCVTFYIFNRDFSKVSMQLHKKLGFYVAAGGHVEENESHEDALKREIKEELGIEYDDIDFPEFLQPRVSGVLQPITIYKVSPEENHYHYDFIFAGLIDEDTEFMPGEDESKNFKWFKIEEITTAVTDQICVTWINKIVKMLKTKERNLDV